jgi:hypothetical protein
MKRIFLLALGACALAGNLKADTLGFPSHSETVWQQVGRSLDTMAQVDVARESRLQRAEARQNAIDHAEAKAEAQTYAQEVADARQAADQKRQADFRALCQAQGAGQQPAECDSNGTIERFLKINGYPQPSLVQIEAVRSYMQSHGLQHVWQIAQ